LGGAGNGAPLLLRKKPVFIPTLSGQTGFRASRCQNQFSLSLTLKPETGFYEETNFREAKLVSG